MGHAVMSFEYNKKNLNLKIRIWQLLDLIMPPRKSAALAQVNIVCKSLYKCWY